MNSCLPLPRTRVGFLRGRRVCARAHLYTGARYVVVSPQWGLRPAEDLDKEDEEDHREGGNMWPSSLSLNLTSHIEVEVKNRPSFG